MVIFRQTFRVLHIMRYHGIHNVIPIACFCHAFSIPGGTMHDYSFYSAILGLSSLWRIENVTVDERSGDIELHIQSRKGSRFCCTTCGAIKRPSGQNKVRWLHENGHNIRFYITALIPVITCERCGEVKLNLPWEQSSQPCDRTFNETEAKMNRSPANPM